MVKGVANQVITIQVEAVKTFGAQAALLLAVLLPTQHSKVNLADVSKRTGMTEREIVRAMWTLGDFQLMGARATGPGRLAVYVDWPSVQMRIATGRNDGRPAGGEVTGIPTWFWQDQTVR